MEKMEANLDQESKAELADNTWLKGQVKVNSTLNSIHF